MKIAIMQPYFIPYAGYLRLLCASDLFVVYDCVQFPRRGWVHRNKLKNQAGELDWLTLPLAKQPFNDPIKSLRLNAEIVQEWKQGLLSYPAMKVMSTRYPELFAAICRFDQTGTQYIVGCLREICSILEIPFNVVYSSDLNLPDSLKAQDRILAIAKHFDADEYINAPGGRELYNESDFAAQNIKLSFLPDYVGDYSSIVELLAWQEPVQIRNNLFEQCECEQGNRENEKEIRQISTDSTEQPAAV